MNDSVLIDDMKNIVTSIAEKFPDYKFIITGHSMGGAIAAKFVKLYETEQTFRIKALIVLDVAEGSALDALPLMNSIIDQRPKSFNSLQESLTWSYSSRTLLNKNSAKLSVPQMLYSKNANSKNEYLWRVNLKQTSKFWQSWFTGMNDAFLGVNVPKILILAHKDRMDKRLIIEQMQGKFRLVILMREVGHCIMEDEPQELSIKMIEFLDMFKVNVDFKIKSVY